MTPENVEESAVQNWYAKWAQEAKANDSLYTQYGEIKYFGIKYLQDEDYHCGLGFGGYNRRPSWCDIAKIYPGDPGTARKVYFASKMQNLVNLIIKVIYVSTKHKLSLRTARIPTLHDNSNGSMTPDRSRYWLPRFMLKV